MKKKTNVLKAKAKILKYVPIIHVIYFFRWIKVCYDKHVSISDYLKVMFKSFIIVAVIHIPRGILMTTVQMDEWLINILTFVSGYLTFLFMACVFIKVEEKYDNIS